MEEVASTSKPARQKTYSRRVSFNEDTILPPRERRRDYSASDIESRVAFNRRRCRVCGRICNSCCFWISLAVAILLFLPLLFGGIYFGFLKSHMPDVRLHRIAFAPDDSSAAVANLTVFLNATNGGDRTVLIYSKMIASVAASGVQFSVVRLADVRQPPKNSTVLEVAGVGDAAARNLQRSALVIDVNVKGRMDMIVRGRKMHGFPFKIECRRINQSEIDAGHAPPCRAEVSLTAIYKFHRLVQ